MRNIVFAEYKGNAGDINGRRNGRKTFFLIFLLFVSFSILMADAKERMVKNLIVCVGDGMGFTQLYLGRLVSRGVKEKLAIETLPVTGFMTTWCLDELVTDSAAAATALWTGHKTNRGMISMLPEGEKPLTLAEVLMKKGLSVGLVTTTPVTDATPAALAAHVNSRKEETVIAEQLLGSGLSIILGGGRGFFLPRGTPGSLRKDSRNLIEEARKAGFSVVQDSVELSIFAAKHSSSGKKKGKKEVERLLGLFAGEDMLPVRAVPSLGEMTAVALSVLSGDDDGFFLMIEGGLIDIFCHRQDGQMVGERVVEFDKAVEKVLEFAKKDGRTLVVVVADHESGGMCILGGTPERGDVRVKFATEHHTGAPVPVLAFGPGAGAFAGVHDSTEFCKIIAGLMNIEKFPENFTEKKASYSPLRVISEAGME